MGTPSSAKKAYKRKKRIIENNYKDHMNLSSRELGTFFFFSSFKGVQLNGQVELEGLFLLCLGRSSASLCIPFCLPPSSSRPPHSFLQVPFLRCFRVVLPPVKRKSQYFQTFSVATQGPTLPAPTDRRSKHLANPAHTWGGGGIPTAAFRVGEGRGVCSLPPPPGGDS